MIKSDDIVNARKTRGMTQAELAESGGVNQSTVWRWENGHPPTRGTALVFVRNFIADTGSDLAEALSEPSGAL